MSRPNLFIQNLAQAVSDRLMIPKLLVAPSHRVGRQWLDQVACLTGSVVNVRTTSIRRLMMEYARPALDVDAIRPAQKEELIRMIGLAVAGLAGKDKNGGYFASLPPSLSFTESLLRSLEDLENADIKSGRSLAGKLVTQEKIEEMTSLIAGFRLAKRKANVAGTVEVARAALNALKQTKRDELPLLLLPASIREEAVGYERIFIERWPWEACLLLPEDFTIGIECNVRTVVADCIANETRGVFRKVLADRLHLDQVEAVCLDPGTYVPALCEAGLEMFSGKMEDLPLTFAGGIPAVFSRPVRLVQAWLRWIQEDLPPVVLADCIEAGLLGEEWQREAPGLTASSLAARIKALPLQAGPAGYRKAFGQEDAGEDMNAAEQWLARAVTMILPLSDDGSRLDFAADKILDAACELLRYGTENDGKLDAYARLALREGIAVWSERCDWPGFDGLDWLERFTAGLRVMGMGPQPGKMHVSDGVAGGHAGRRVTFVLGVDEARCPGTVRQDPVLLDRERRELSRKLPGSTWKRERREKAVDRLFARLRGEVILSYAKYDAVSGREAYPAQIVMKFSSDGGDEGIQTFRPVMDNACLHSRDDWLRVLLVWKRNAFTAADLAPWFPGLAAGEEAVEARKSASFTAWDGYVPEAGEDFVQKEWVLSPSQLEGLATSPMDFFFRRALGVAKPKRWSPEPGRWLAGNERGQLLHDLYQEFMTKLEERKEAASENHASLLNALLYQALESWRGKVPVRDELAFTREKAHLFEAAAIFLINEIARSKQGRPICFEAAVGGAPKDEPPWRRKDPVRFDFGDDGAILLQGRVDRVDRLHDHGGLVVWDYKTGKSSGFSRTDPFSGGRHLQPYLYTIMLEKSLEEAGFPERVREFCYFFPMLRDEGGVISYRRDELFDGHTVVKALAGLLRGGCFPFARSDKDVKNSDYLEIYDNPKSLASNAALKEDPDGRIAAWRRLDAKPGKKTEAVDTI